MNYLYPSDFPSAARAAVTAKKIRAGLELAQAKQIEHSLSEVEAALRHYILQVFIAFAENAFMLARQGLWTVERVDDQSREFLRLTMIEACAEKGRDGATAGTWASHMDGSILPAIQREFEKSPEWRRYLDGLLELAELQANGHSPTEEPGKAANGKGRGSQARGRGFRADLNRHHAVARAVNRHDTHWKAGSTAWRREANLRSICADLDATEIDIPTGWKTGRTPRLRGLKLKGWCDALELGHNKAVAVVIQDVVWQADMCFTKPDMGMSLPWVLNVADKGALQLSKSYRICGITV
jgi:hypothetical protein